MVALPPHDHPMKARTRLRGSRRSQTMARAALLSRPTRHRMVATARLRSRRSKTSQCSEACRSWQAMAGADAYAGFMLTPKSVVFRNEFPNAPSVREKGARRTKFQAQKCRGVAQPGRASGSETGRSLVRIQSPRPLRNINDSFRSCFSPMLARLWNEARQPK
jgi:hypothetical protein